LKRRALTLLELLATVAIVGILIALLLPAVQGAREAGRRTQCSSNIRQVAMALHSYESAHGVLPNTAPNNYSFHVVLLPYLEQKALYEAFDFQLNGMDYKGPLEYRRLTLFECPSDGSRSLVPRLPAVTNYHGNWGSGNLTYGNNGIFSYHDDRPGFVRYLPLRAITDGLSQTALLAEVLASDDSSHRLRYFWKTSIFPQPGQINKFAAACRGAPGTDGQPSMNRIARGRPWLECGFTWTIYNHILTPNQPSCSNGPSIAMGAFTSSSFHPAIVNVAMADGSVQAVGEGIDVSAWRAIGSRDGVP
jgi:prepilin-type N-terminal cleavage/methylation domain-containing protein/prepilin-type processing-associated H-X9-DG protein